MTSTITQTTTTTPLPAMETEPKTSLDLSAEAQQAIAKVIGPRLLIAFRELDRCFTIARGTGVGRHTLRDWEADGMPHHHHPGDRYYFYSWPDVWAWYCVRGATRKQPITSLPITAQTWARRP